MTRAFWIHEFWRWILAPCASVLAFFGALYFSLFVLFFGPFPRSLAEPTAGFIMSSLIVLAGSFVAPRHRVVTAIILCLVGILSAIFFLSFHAIGASVGGLIAVAFVAWWFHPRRTVRSTSWVAIGAGAALFAFIGLVYARYVDRPARPEQLPVELTHALGTNASRVTAFYRYDLGGFIDHQWLWRIDAKPDAVALIITGLSLQSTNAVPQRFWRMPPHYWPRSMPPGAEAFQSQSFFADRRGHDGAHYFLLHDKTQQRAFVWFKSNF
jgi:hypothetical protein